MIAPNEIVDRQEVSLTALTTRQAETYDVLEQEVNRLEGSANRVPRSRLTRVYQHGVALHHLCETLEAQLAKEDARLTADGTSPEMDERWIRNLRRLEKMRTLLHRTKVALP